MMYTETCMEFVISYTDSILGYSNSFDEFSMLNKVSREFWKNKCKNENVCPLFSFPRIPFSYAKKGFSGMNP